MEPRGKPYSPNPWFEEAFGFRRVRGWNGKFAAPGLAKFSVLSGATRVSVLKVMGLRFC